MTESEWLACQDPPQMLEFVSAIGLDNDRKSRLLGCAFCRRMWHLLIDPRTRRAVEVTELFADARAGRRALMEAEEAANEARAMLDADEGVTGAVRAAALAVPRLAHMTWPLLMKEDHPATEKDREWLARALPAVGFFVDRDERCRLFRCLFGNPFRPLTIDPAWLTWNGGVVVRLARAAYDERDSPSGTLDPGRLAVLADALEEAGCSDAELLQHLRGAGPHARGCWALAGVLGKE